MTELRTRGLMVSQSRFDGFWTGSKSVIVQMNDQDFEATDILLLQEHDSSVGLTGRWVRAGVIQVDASVPALHPKRVAIKLRLIDRSDTPALLRLWRMFCYGWWRGHQGS